MSDVYRISPWPISRLRFFAGEGLFYQDMVAEQAYHLGQRQVSSRALRTPGIAEGWKVQADGWQVRVSAGSAFDGDGNVITLAPSSLEPKPAGPVDEKQQTGFWNPAEAGSWMHAFINPSPSVNLLLYVRFCESPERGPGVSIGFSRFEQTPIIDTVNEGQKLPPGALFLALLRVGANGFTLGWGSGPWTRQYSGLLLPAPSGSEAPRPLSSYARALAHDGSVRVDLGGQDGVVLGLTSPGGPVDPMTGAAAMTAAVDVRSEGVIAFAASLAGERLSSTSAALRIGHDLLVAPAAGPAAISGHLRATSLAVDAGRVTISAPSFSSEGVLSSADAGVIFGSALHAGSHALEFTGADRQPRGFLAAVGEGGVGVAGSGGTSLGVSQGGSFSGALTIAGSGVTCAGELRLGEVTAGSVEARGGIAAAGFVRSRWSAQTILDNKTELDSNGELTSASFAVAGGAVIFTLGGLLLCWKEGELPPTASFTMTLTLDDGTPVGTMSGAAQYLEFDQPKWYCAVAFPQTQLHLVLPAAAARSLRVKVEPVPELIREAPPATNLFATILQLPVDELGAP